MYQIIDIKTGKVIAETSFGDFAATYAANLGSTVRVEEATDGNS